MGGGRKPKADVVSREVGVGMARTTGGEELSAMSTGGGAHASPEATRALKGEFVSLRELWR